MLMLVTSLLHPRCLAWLRWKCGYRAAGRWEAGSRGGRHSWRLSRLQMHATKPERTFCSMEYSFIRGNTKESSAIQMCLLFFGWSFLMRSDLIGPAWLGHLTNLARPLTSGEHLCKGSNHSSALQISWWMDYAMDSLRQSAPHWEICWRHDRNDIAIVLSSHPCRANTFKVLLQI